MTEHLLVIGAQRCGTTYLSSLLDAHPEITMARPGRPEPKVFLSDELTGRGLGWYRDTYFAHATNERVLGEKSTSYLEDPGAPGRARRMLGEPHVLAVLRDPVARAVSNWRFSTDNRFEARPLEEALRANLDGPQHWDGRSSSVSPYAYLERGRYADMLPVWLSAFPSTTRVLFLDDLLGAPTPTAELYSAIGVDSGYVPEDAGRPVNRSDSPAPALPEELERRLWEYFAESDAALRTLLGKELPWAT